MAALRPGAGRGRKHWNSAAAPPGWNPGRAIAPAGTWGGNQEIGFWFLVMAHPVGKYVAFLLDPRRLAPEFRRKARATRASLLLINARWGSRNPSGNQPEPQGSHFFNALPGTGRGRRWAQSSRPRRAAQAADPALPAPRHPRRAAARRWPVVHRWQRWCTGRAHGWPQRSGQAGLVWVPL